VALVGDLLEALLQSLLDPQKLDKWRKRDWALEGFNALTASLNSMALTGDAWLHA
jgi:hypothetical protein